MVLELDQLRRRFHEQSRTIENKHAGGREGARFIN